MADLILDIPVAESVGTGYNPNLDKSLSIPVAGNIGTGLTPITPAVIDIPIGENVATGLNPGTDLMLDIPVAGNVATGIVPSPWMWPQFNLFDEDGNYLHSIIFEDVYPGMRSAVKKLTFKNQLPGDVTVSVTPGEPYLDANRAIETTNSTYLSLDGVTYSNTINLDVLDKGSTDFYLYYQPPSTSLIGSKRWRLVFDYTSSVFELWDYINAFTVTSNSDTDQTDVIITITIPYSAGNMETDFSDIRFYYGTLKLDSTIDYKTDSVSATFLVRIPTLDADEIKTIYILAGNSSMDLENDLSYDEYWSWQNKEVGVYNITPWEKIAGDNQSEVVYIDYKLASPNLFGHNVLALWDRTDYTDPVIEVDAEGAYGRWNIQLYFDRHNDAYVTAGYRYFDYDFIHDGTDYYRLRCDLSTWIGPWYFKLYKNGELLTTSENVPFGVETLRTILIERTINGAFTISMDGTEYLTHTDNTITESVKQRLTTTSTATSGIRRYTYVDYINFIEYTGNVPTIGSLGTWDDLLYGVALLGNVSYDPQELPGLTGNLRYGIRIDGVLYE
jgi:hypothetical protein